VIELRGRRILRLRRRRNAHDDCRDDRQHQTYRSQRDHPHLPTLPLETSHHFKIGRPERELGIGVGSFSFFPSVRRERDGKRTALAPTTSSFS
jgi:hypothetical protein